MLNPYYKHSYTKDCIVIILPLIFLDNGPSLILNDYLVSTRLNQ